ncbi:flagellar filament capping protein FliD [Apirhabdus apintestini]|nr:flagellar filament capping protein FliD [Enterobacteriaceae bacterium CA-0114]
MSEDQTNGEQLVLNKDSSAVKDAIKDFVEKFNALNSKINTSRYSDVAANATSGSKKSDDDDKNKVPDGALVSDSTIRDLASALLGTAAGSVTGNGNHDVMSLSDIGISIDAKTGEMKIDETKLDTVLETNGDDVQKMLMGAGDKPGLADSLLKDVANKYLGDSASGTKSIIDDTTKGLNDKLKTLQTQIDRTNDLIDSQMDVYTKQFQNLDKIMTQMQGTSSALIAALGGQ